MKQDLPAQIKNLIDKVNKSIDREEYRFSRHAIKRGIERSISGQDVLYVLKNGCHEENKTSFDFQYNTWKYAINGTTVDAIDVRVIIAFEKEMVIITVVRLMKKKFRRRS